MILATVSRGDLYQRGRNCKSHRGEQKAGEKGEFGEHGEDDEAVDSRYDESPSLR